MKHFQKIFGVFVFGLFTSLLIPQCVNATEYEENLIKRIAPDGKNVVVKAVKPKNDMEVFEYINILIQKMLNDDDYEAYMSCPEDVTKCQIDIHSVPVNDVIKFSKIYDVNVTYDEPEENVKIDAYVNQLKDFDWDKLDTYIKITDLGLINYYMTSEKSELWNPNAANRAIKYSKDIIDITNGSNVSFLINVGAGDQGDEYLFETAIGEMSILYNGYAYKGKQQGVYLRRVLYIPESTENTKEAYITAAQKRIDDYLGKTGLVTVSYGGILPTDGREDSLIDVNDTDGNYYNVSVKVNGKTKVYPFYIMKGTEEDLKVPTYIGSDMNTNITITNNDPYIPLDTSLNVKNVIDDNIKKVLGTDKYKAFDIKLYSDGKGSLIEKSADKFLVRMPVPEEFKGKSLIVNYINSNNEKEPHEVTLSPDGKYLTFETYHFSTYILSENTNVKVPGTGDNILMYFIIGMISIVGFTSTSIYLNKRYN